MNLNWTPCFDKFTCSRLQVPLDYTDPSAGNTAIAFIKHPALNASAETRDILYNPGGPGDTGVGELLSLIDDLRFILGDTHDIVGFDPRGVNNSGPSIG
jgi:pimeloyl-ACP methyl ester carboxylesterase